MSVFLSTFCCFPGKICRGNWSRRVITAVIWPVSVELWTLTLWSVTIWAIITLISDNKKFQRRSPLRKEICQKTNSALGTWCGCRKMYLLDGI